jgi:uncharacterized protein YbjQ (UPF0145 family)
VAADEHREPDNERVLVLAGFSRRGKTSGVELEQCDSSGRRRVRKSSVVRVIISTMNDLPGYDIEEVFGEVFGLTVRSRNLGSQVGAGLKSLLGGELKGMTKMLAAGRQDATQRSVAEAEAKGANAIIAFRFDTSELGSTWTEICAYGTAVRARKL